MKLVSAAGTALVLRVAGAGLHILFLAALGRMLSADGVGVVLLALAPMSIASVVARFGLDNAVLRGVAKALSEHDYGRSSVLRKLSLRFALAFGLIVSVVLFVIAGWIGTVVFDRPGLGGLIRIAAVAVAPLTLMVISSQGLKAVRKPGLATLVGHVLLPMFSIVLALLVVPAYGLVGAMWSYVAGGCCAALFGVVAWSHGDAYGSASQLEAYLEVAPGLMRACAPLFVASSLQVVIQWVPTVMAGIWLLNEDVAILGVGLKIAMLMSFVLVAVDTVAAPGFAGHWHMGRLDDLKKLTRSSALLMIGLGVPVFIVFVVWGNELMSAFGSGFEGVGYILVIIGCGQLINVATGSVTSLLIMSNHQRSLISNLAVVAIAAVLLQLVLLTQLGLVGAASAIAATLAVQNLGALGLVRFKLGFWVYPSLRLPVGWRSIMLRPR